MNEMITSMKKKQNITNAVYTSRDKLTRDGGKNATLNRFNMIKFCHKTKNSRIHRQTPFKKKEGIIMKVNYILEVRLSNF